MKIFEILLIVYLTLIIGYYGLNLFIRLMNKDAEMYTFKNKSLKRIFEERE